MKKGKNLLPKSEHTIDARLDKIIEILERIEQNTRPIFSHLQPNPYIPPIYPQPLYHPNLPPFSPSATWYANGHGNDNQKLC